MSPEAGEHEKCDIRMLIALNFFPTQEKEVCVCVEVGLYAWVCILEGWGSKRREYGEQKEKWLSSSTNSEFLAIRLTFTPLNWQSLRISL